MHRKGAQWTGLGSSVRGGLKKPGKHRTAIPKPLPQLQLQPLQPEVLAAKTKSELAEGRGGKLAPALSLGVACHHYQNSEELRPGRSLTFTTLPTTPSCLHQPS